MKRTHPIYTNGVPFHKTPPHGCLDMRLQGTMSHMIGYMFSRVSPMLEPKKFYFLLHVIIINSMKEVMPSATNKC